ncbi:glutathione binding-like protein [Acidomonas methanolica]|uniref:glutathione binding-like protein n=1 Tax=Acidomonas methanolica TaxID=437 RepID=UPI00211A8104|nr:glutathione binding-like protein [Acidomonas methanolica]MCQ9154234.1 glutathione S-transferase [Acidomonas methanolica]
MLTLYYAPGACSLASHIVIREAEMSCQYEKVDLRKKTYGDGRDYLAINPRGAVPAIGLPSGGVLTQNVAVLPWLGEHSGVAAFTPAAGIGRSRLLEALGFCEDVHAALAPLFASDLPDATRARLKSAVERRMGQVEASIGGRGSLLESGFSQADVLLAVLLRWEKPLGLDFSPWPEAVALRDRVLSRPAARAAMAEEGLI